MATQEQQQELVEALKGPHYYKIYVNGYGAETAYLKISKEAFEFWKEHTQSGDSDLITYMTSSEDNKVSDYATNQNLEWNSLDPADLTPEVCFLHDDPEDFGSPWYESSKEFDHVWAVASDSASVYVEKMDGLDYDSKFLEDVIDGEEINDIVQRVGENTDWEVEVTEGLENGAVFANKGEYVCQLMSSEKGCFFEASFETTTLFDEKKLKFIIDEAPNGEDTLFGIQYDGEELDNNGGDTNGKGYYGYVWKQEF